MPRDVLVCRPSCPAPARRPSAPADPAWYSGRPSPYYKPHHAAWRNKLRAFVDAEITPNVHEWDEQKKLPLELFRKMGAAGVLPGFVGEWPSGLVDASMDPPAWDGFNTLIAVDELSRCGSGGVVWGVIGGLGIGLPPVLRFGTEEMKRRVAQPVLRGEKVICLAITEPTGGSDVANLRTSAVKDEANGCFVLNGNKKWITNGVFADYFVVACRTGGKGMWGVSLLLVEKDMPGVTCKQMDCMGVWASGTTYIEFDDVKVPFANLIGPENGGFMCMMSNFNHERLGIVFQAIRFSRVCLEDAFKFAMKRKTFGKRLVDHQVIRHKLADMAREIEACQAHCEAMVYEMQALHDSGASMQEEMKIGGDTALLKVQSTRMFERCAREAAQIFGGASYVRGGQGERVERLYREVRALAIPGGSEEIMLELASGMAIKGMEKATSK